MQHRVIHNCTLGRSRVSKEVGSATAVFSNLRYHLNGFITLSISEGKEVARDS
jgi:hypothetical protein